MAFAQTVDPNTQQIAQLSNFNNPNDIPLSLILENAIQRTYHKLTVMTDMFPTTSDREKKIQILLFACQTRELFMRLYALVKFRRTAHINVSNILSFLDQQAYKFVDTADFLYHLARVKLVNARLPNFCISTAVDVLTLGTYPKLPTCIKDRILPPEPITDKEKLTTLQTLNRIIQARLALSELPSQFQNFKIEKGYVKFHVKNEFEVMLTVVSNDSKLPWRLLHVKILVKNPQDPNRTLVHPFQVQYIHEILQKRLYENDKPLLDLFKSLHFFCQSLKLEILIQQMDLNQIKAGKFYRIVEPINSKQINVKYWLEFSKNEYDFRFSIMTSDTSDYLQTSHYPPLNWKDHKEIDNIFKSNDLLIDKIIYKIVKIRSRRRLLDLRSKLSSFSYCSTSFDDNKPSLKLHFLHSKCENETLYISIDYYSGIFSVLLPFSPPNFNILTQIEACLNNDISKLEAYILKLRTWLMLKRCELSLRQIKCSCLYELPIVSFLNNDLATQFNKLEKTRLYFEFKKQEKLYVMITCKTKEDLNNSQEPINWHENTEFLDDDYALRLNYYLLKVAKCKFDGELDPGMQYLKLMSISHLKRSSIINFNDFSINDVVNELATSYTVPSYEITKSGSVFEVVKMMSSVKERLPILSFVSSLNKQNLMIQNVQIDQLIGTPLLSLLTTPKLHTKELQQIGADLFQLIVSCKIRRVNYIKNSTFQTQSQKLSMRAFNYSIEFKFKEKIIVNDSINETANEQQQQQQQHFNPALMQRIGGSFNEISRIDLYTVYLDLKNPEQLFEFLKAEWHSMCLMYKLLKQVQHAFKQNAELHKTMRISMFNFKQLVINYGVNFTSKILFQSLKNMYDVYLLTNNTHSLPSTIEAPLSNYQIMYLHEIRKYFHRTHNVVNLVQILNETCMPMFSFAKLLNIPKFNLSAIPVASFMLLIVSLTHFKLTYYSRYCLDIHVQNNGLVSIKDGSFHMTNMNVSSSDFYPIQFLSAFLNLFRDETVEEILRRRSSMVEDDNPVSPAGSVPTSGSSALQHQLSQPPLSQQQQQQQNPHHVFIQPTSPAIRPSLPIPSPMHTGYAQSPGPNITQPPSNQPPSIAPSPGFQNFGSPAFIAHSSPGPIMSHPTAQSPGDFMSPAPQNYSIQSPANYDTQLQSPITSTKSPFNMVGPSPNAQNINPNTPLGGQQTTMKDNLDDGMGRMHNTSMRNAIPTGTHYKKIYSAAIPNYLSQNGFAKMLSVNSETGFSPLETFLATSYIKKFLIKHIQNDTHSFRLTNSEKNAFSTACFNIQLANDISPDHYTAFSIQKIDPQINYQDTLTDLLKDYFHSRILAPPYKPNAALAYFNLLSVQDIRILREFMQLIDIEMSQAQTYNPLHIKLQWTVPHNLVKVPNSIFQTIFQPYGPAFHRKDKYYFLIQFIYYHRTQQQQHPITYTGSCFMAYDQKNIQFEFLKGSSFNEHFENKMMQSLTQILDNYNRHRMLPDCLLSATIHSLIGNFGGAPVPTPLPMQTNMM